MGYPLPKETLHPNKNTKDMQKYYSQTYRDYVDTQQQENQARREVVGSIYSRTRVPTDTRANRDLALLDVDKLISFNVGSLQDSGQRVKYMRMVAALMQQSSDTFQVNNNIQELARSARNFFEGSVRRLDQVETEQSNYQML